MAVQPATPPLTVYLSARYIRKREMLTYAGLLRTFGFTVNARWLKRDEPPNPTAEQLAAWAEEDMRDVFHCDWFITSTECHKHVVGDPGHGGRMVELGMALATMHFSNFDQPRITIIGPREGIFCSLPEVERYPDWPSFVDWMTKECAPW